MTLIHNISIRNFRGIKKFDQEFYSKKLICLIGRGDTGKTTILEAISLVLSPYCNISFYDTDFYKCDILRVIKIEATLINIPDYFMREPYGLYIRGFDRENGVLFDEIKDNHEPALTIRMTVDKNLEPIWQVINNRTEPINISANARAKLNVHLVADFMDSHFSWGKGKPLNSIFAANQEIGDDDEDSSSLLDVLRDTKYQIDNKPFRIFDKTIDLLKSAAGKFGIDISQTNTTIDFKDLNIKNNRVCLHDEYIPFRQKGKGSKRLISIAIQSCLANIGGLVLIDEVEQGLEPDRVKHLVRRLAEFESGQIFICTHSQNVIEELNSNNLYLINNVGGICHITNCNDKYQGLVRKCPEAMYAKKVIVCEGRTEIGICKAIDERRVLKGKPSMAELGVVYTLGEGSNFSERAISLKELGLDVSVLCDSDKDDELNPSKQSLLDQNILIIDCKPGNSIETQTMIDLNWLGIQKLIGYVIKKFGSQNVTQLLHNSYEGTLPPNWLETDNPKIRTAISLAAQKGKWFKQIGHGEFLGFVIIKNAEYIEGTKLISQFRTLSKWLDDGSF